MMDTRHSIPENINGGGFKEAVCINAERIYDSCSSKDCLEDLRVFFPDTQQDKLNHAANIRIKKAEIITVFSDMEPVTFNRGFYSVDMTYYFKVTVEAVLSPLCPPETFCGAAVFNKKAILYGSDGSVKVFSTADGGRVPGRTSPKAIIQAADPVALSARLCDSRSCCECCHCSIPENICNLFDGSFGGCSSDKVVLATIGVFSIVQLVREVQMLIPAYDFCIPDKECVTTSDNPCDLFRKIDFPTDEFFPPRLDCEEGCGCCK